MSSGVELKNERPGIKPGEHIHTESDEWCIYSNVPVDVQLLSCTVLDLQMPGRLGEFLLPEDAVFCLRKKKSTSLQDWKHTWDVEQEQTVSRTEASMRNHFSVQLLMREEEEECYDDDDDEEEGEDGEEDDGGDSNNEMDDDDDDEGALSDVQSD